MSTPTSPRPSALSPLVALALGIRFLTELALIAAAAWAGAARTRNILLGIVLGVVAAVVVVAVWSFWIAPASRRRLPDPARLMLELLLFGAAAAGLVLAGRPLVAAIVGVVGAVMAVVVRFLPEQRAQREDDVGAESAGEATVAEARTADAVTGAPGDPAPLRRPRGRDRARPRN